MAENEIKNNAAENQNPAPVEPPVENPAENNADQAPAKKSWGKKIAKIALTVLIVLVVLVLLLLWQLDRVAATATCTVGSAITGTKVDVESISIRPLAGSVKIKGFTVGNAEGFHNPTAIKVGNLHVAVNTSSVLTDKIVVDHLEISDVAIDMEYGISKGSNLDALLKNVEKNTGADKKKAQAAKEEKQAEDKPAAQKQVVIRKLILKNSKVTVSSGMLKTTMSIPLVPISMENVGEKTDMAGAIQEVLVRIMAEIANVVNFDAIGKGIVSGADAVGKGANAVGKGIVSGVEGAGEAVGGAVTETVNLFKQLPGVNKNNKK